jgi:hypothetical protein
LLEKGFAQLKLSTPEILKSIRDFQYFSAIDQNDKNASCSKNFLALVKQQGNELPVLFSKIARFVLDHPHHEIPLFLQGE